MRTMMKNGEKWQYVYIYYGSKNASSKGLLSSVYYISHMCVSVYNDTSHSTALNVFILL